MAKTSRYHDLYVGFARPIDCRVARWMEDRGIPQCVESHSRRYAPATAHDIFDEATPHLQKDGRRYSGQLSIVNDESLHREISLGHYEYVSSPDQEAVDEITIHLQRSTRQKIGQFFTGDDEGRYRETGLDYCEHDSGFDHEASEKSPLHLQKDGRQGTDHFPTDSEQGGY
jgi:hypothetical protein